MANMGLSLTHKPGFSDEVGLLLFVLDEGNGDGLQVNLRSSDFYLVVDVMVGLK
jgi:hypothetical protein